MNPTNPEISQPNHLGRFAAVVVATGLLLGACGSDNQGISLHPAGTEATAPGANPDLPSNESDQSLRDGNFKCGGEIGTTSMKDLSYKYDFFTASPENKHLAQSVKENLVTDPTVGMGEKGFQYILDYAYANPDTKKGSAGKEMTGDAQFDEAVALLITREVTNPNGEVYLNGDCRNNPNNVTMPSPDKPFIRIQYASSVEGFVLPMDKLAGFNEVVNKYDDGSAMFLIVPYLNEKGEQIGWHVATFANGCDNPIRLAPPKKTPDTTTTTPGTTTTPTTPPTTGTTIPVKVPVPPVGPNTNPGANGSPEAGMDPQNDSNQTGYGPGDSIPTVPPNPDIPTTTAAAPQPTAETGTLAPGTSVVANGTNVTAPPNTDPTLGGISGDPGAPQN